MDFTSLHTKESTRLINDIQPETQCGLHADQETTDMTFSLCQIKEKCMEQNILLCMIFVDFTKAFDTVNMKETRMPWHFIKLVSVLNTGMKALISLRGELLESYEVGKGIKQVCPDVVLDFSFYGVIWYLHWFKVDWRLTCSMQVNLSLQEGSEIFWYMRLCLLTTLALWHTTTKMHKK